MYLLFGGDFHYPRGGALDLLGPIDGPDAANDPRRADLQWWHVLDLSTGAIVSGWRVDGGDWKQ